MARPTKYTKKKANEICRRIANGESLTSICKEPTKPTKTTVFNWLDNPKNEEFLNQYTRARERQAESFVDECVDIADYREQDTIKKKTKSGEEHKAPDHEWINRSKLRVETRIKVAEKLFPKKYTTSFKQVEVDLKNISDDELDARIAALEEALKKQLGEDNDRE